MKSRLDVKFFSCLPIYERIRYANESSMSSTSALGSSSSATYAVQLAQTSALQRSLYNLDTAVQSGNLSSAGSNLAAIMKAYPQYAPSASDSSSSQDPVNQGFQALADAIGKNDAAGAKTAWTKIKSELTKEGLPALKNPTDNTALVLAQNKESMDQSVLSSLFGTSSSTTPSVDSLLGGASSS